jgi:hypothetical protein
MSNDAVATAPGSVTARFRELRQGPGIQTRRQVREVAQPLDTTGAVWFDRCGNVFWSTVLIFHNSDTSYLLPISNFRLPIGPMASYRMTIDNWQLEMLRPTRYRVVVLTS